MVRFSFSSHELMALPQGALFWPARRALLVADLHLEKASWFARFGQMLPPYDSVATLADLTALAVDQRRPRNLVPGRQLPRPPWLRPPAGARARDADRPHRSRRWTWITGNHDPGLRRPLRRSHRRGSRGRRPDPAPPGRSGRDPAGTVGAFPSQAADHPSRPPGFPALLRGDPAKADPARLRIADRRPRRLPSRDRAGGRSGSPGPGSRRRPTAQIPDRGLSGQEPRLWGGRYTAETTSRRSIMTDQS